MHWAKQNFGGLEKLKLLTGFRAPNRELGYSQIMKTKTKHAHMHMYTHFCIDIDTCMHLNNSLPFAK